MRILLLNPVDRSLTGQKDDIRVRKWYNRRKRGVGLMQQRLLARLLEEKEMKQQMLTILLKQSITLSALNICIANAGEELSKGMIKELRKTGIMVM
ncbi:MULTISPECIES: hypothetical protein [Desulfitobacterium]|nr:MULTISPECIES: hypothetical protein [Desulfitobacterium]MEA5025047.1 hypothetical protein [Desulfitobacterium hafniense]